MLLWLASSTLHVKFLPRRATRNTHSLLPPPPTRRQPPFLSSSLNGRRRSTTDPSLLLSSLVRGWRGVYPHVSRGKRIYSRWTGNRRGRDGLSAREQCHCASPSAIGQASARIRVHKGGIDGSTVRVVAFRTVPDVAFFGKIFRRGYLTEKKQRTHPVVYFFANHGSWNHDRFAFVSASCTCWGGEAGKGRVRFNASPSSPYTAT